MRNITIYILLALKEEALSGNALELEKLINTALGNKYKTVIVDDLDEVGGGSIPGVVLHGKAVAVIVPEPGVNEVQTRLRKAKIPVICRINKDRILLNVRTLEKNDYPIIVEALAGIVE